MSFRINTNTVAESAANNLSNNSNAVATNIQRLSSGLRINSASDDAAGLVISESLRAQSAGLTQATSNTNDAINVVKTAEGALNEVHSLLINIRQLVVHSANVGVNDPTAEAADKAAIQQAVDSIDRIAKTTQFNNKNLLIGQGAAGAAATGTETTANTANSLVFQIGANNGQTVSVSVNDSRSINLGKEAAGASYTGVGGTASTFAAAHSLADLGTTGSAGATGIDVTDTTGAGAQEALKIVDQAISDVSTTRANLGAVQSNQLQSNVRSLAVAQQNTDASESTIRDTDLSSEIVSFTKNQILVQAGTSALAQANSAPQAILKLLQ